MAKYYDLLGIPNNASDDEIRKAYRKKAMQHHPDKGGDPEMFKDINNAYEVLSTPEKRRMYDQLGDQGYQEASQGGGPRSPFDAHFGPEIDPMNIFEHFFGFGGPHGPRGGQGGPEVVHHRLKISLEDSFLGVKKNIRMAFTKECPRCKQTCPSCRGSGFVEQILNMGFIRQVLRKPCGDCEGKGHVAKKGGDCTECNGSGSVQKEEHFHINIVAGTTNGAQQSVRTSTHQIVFVVEVTPHPVFKRQGNNLIMEVHMGLRESILGKTIAIPHFENMDMKLNTAEYGPVVNGQVITIPGKGFQDVETGRRGDLLLVLDVKPSKKGKLTEAAIEKLSKALDDAEFFF